MIYLGKGGKFKKRLGKFKKRLCEILLPWPTGIPDVRRGGALVCVLMAGHACADDLGSHALLCVCMHRAPARSPKGPPLELPLFKIRICGQKSFVEIEL